MVALSARGIAYQFSYEADPSGCGPYFAWAEGIGLGWCETLDELLELAKDWRQRLPEQ